MNWLNGILALLALFGSSDFLALVKRIIELFKNMVMPADATNAQKKALAVDMALQTEEAKRMGAGEWVAGQAVEMALLIVKPSRARNALVTELLERGYGDGNSG